mmetsp:Transcript_75699/g.239347  ORF Transcript_75699/g.239347 Transcript_75699/m.239347 type:complete len:452 (+) Transcript_75699:94-1449(+)
MHSTRGEQCRSGGSRPNSFLPAGGEGSSRHHSGHHGHRAQVRDAHHRVHLDTIEADKGHLYLAWLLAGLPDIHEVGCQVRIDRRHAVHGHEEAGLRCELHPEHVPLLQGCTPVGHALSSAEVLVTLLSPLAGLHLACAGSPPATTAAVEQAVAVGREVAHALPSQTVGEHLRTVEAEAHDELGRAVEPDVKGAPHALDLLQRLGADQQLRGLARARLLDDCRPQRQSGSAPRGKLRSIFEQPVQLRPSVLQLEPRQPQPQPLLHGEPQPLLQAHPANLQQALCSQAGHTKKAPELGLLLVAMESTQCSARNVAIQESKDGILGLHFEGVCGEELSRNGKGQTEQSFHMLAVPAQVLEACSSTLQGTQVEHAELVTRGLEEALGAAEQRHRVRPQQLLGPLAGPREEALNLQDVGDLHEGHHHVCRKVSTFRLPIDVVQACLKPPPGCPRQH